MSKQTHLFHYKSPMGIIGLELDGDVCVRILPGNESMSEDTPECPSTHPVAKWLSGYFKGEKISIPSLAPGNTPFQEKLRKELLSIPPGEVRTYGELAKRLKSSPRAVGQALGANPLPILIPCHRIISSSGLGGFTFGKDWKRKLLNLERSFQQKA